MIIVERGAKPVPWHMLKHWQCIQCKTVILFEESDRPEMHDDQRDGPSATTACPVCNSRTTFLPRNQRGQP